MESYLSEISQHLQGDWTRLGTNLFVVWAIWGIVSRRKNDLIAYLKRKAEKSDNQIDDHIFGFGVVTNTIMLVPLVMMSIANNILPPGELTKIVEITISVLFPVIITMIIYSSLNVVNAHYSTKEIYKKIPFYALLQLVKIIVLLSAIILVISAIFQKSPVYIFSGLGAGMAVIMLIFKDVITGFVSGLHLVSNDMLSEGDWITMPSKGVDGDVIEVGITTVKVRNFDKTITSVPAQQLTSNVFFNWKGMQDSGGRRIKRSVLIDAASIKMLDEKKINELKSIGIMTEYLDGKLEELTATNKERKDYVGDARSLTNIGTFRRYLVEYLKSRGDIHTDGFTFLIRQLEATELGVPLQMYVFTNTVNWIEYEGIQSDIFDHVLSMANVFGLKVYQRDNK